VLLCSDFSNVETLCRRTPNTIHLLLTDLVLPGIGGRDIAQKVAGIRPGIKVLFMSGYTDDAVIRNHGVDSALAFLQKPFTSAALSAKVREVLDGESLGR
jgi:two-component system cell cycle sensor histidine kinase/response regulator CckA